VTVAQPVQSWTVIRSHSDFLSVGDALSQIIIELPVCPPLNSDVANYAITNDLNAVLRSRNLLQNWLCCILMYPGARDSPAVRNFLTAGANTIAPQYEQVIWTPFNVLMTSAMRPVASNKRSSDDKTGDMEMDDMFMADDDPHVAAPGQTGQNEDNDYNDDVIPSASERYKPTDEAVTDEDEMDIMQFAGEVEMVEDIGSLAQSLGASHLGRSLQLQAGMKHQVASLNGDPVQNGIGAGIGINIQTTQETGGLGNAMASAVTNPFNLKQPVSAPRLDSFKMIKVIGKGSFGKYTPLLFGSGKILISIILIQFNCSYYTIQERCS
jgi:hypothetical protein